MKIKEDACISAQEPKPGLQHVVISVSGCVNIVVFMKIQVFERCVPISSKCYVAVLEQFNCLSKYYIWMLNSASNLTSVNV